MMDELIREIDEIGMRVLHAEQRLRHHYCGMAIGCVEEVNEVGDGLEVIIRLNENGLT